MLFTSLSVYVFDHNESDNDNAYGHHNLEHHCALIFTVVKMRKQWEILRDNWNTLGNPAANGIDQQHFALINFLKNIFLKCYLGKLNYAGSKNCYAAFLWISDTVASTIIGTFCKN